MEAVVADRLRALLVEHDFTEDGIRRRLGRRPQLAAGAAREVYARRLPGDPTATLVRLFALALPVDARAATALPVDELAEAGLVARDGHVIRPLVRIAPFEGLLIASDPDPPGEERRDFVTGVNAAARMLAHLTPRRRFASTLDLGTGSGLQALLAARHSDTVAAVDVNPRAIAYTRLNAGLNGAANVEPLEGSWFEPVRGRQFELIVANPPFVISPETAYVFRDSGLRGDAVCRRLVEQLPDQLADGGVALVLCNWGHRAGEDWRAPPERWIAGRPVDALLLRYWTADPLDYAASWNEPLDRDAAAFAAALDRWLEYDARLGIERISTGVIVLRRRDAARNRVRAIEVPGMPTAGAGEHLARMLAAWDEPVAIADARLVPVDGARLERRLASGEGAWRPDRARFLLEETVGFSVPLEDEVAAVVALCDGRRTVREAIAAASGGSDTLPALRRLYDLGCLERASA